MNEGRNDKTGPVLSFIAGLIASALLTVLGGILIGIIWKSKSSTAYWFGVFFGFIVFVIAIIVILAAMSASAAVGIVLILRY